MTSEQTIAITFLRHGRSRADDEERHEGRYDSPLTEAGRLQARRRAEGWLAQGVRFDLIIASPLLRAAETAAIIGCILETRIETDAAWMEMNNGPLAGLTREEAARLYPMPDFRNPYQPFHGSGESDWEIHRRAGEAVEALVRRGAGAYLVVAHGGILNAALRHIVGAPSTVNGQGIWFVFGDLGYARVKYQPDKHQWTLKFLSGSE